MLRQLQPAVPQYLGAVKQRMHHKVLGRLKIAHVIPGTKLLLRKYIGIAHWLCPVLIKVVIDVIADYQIHFFFLPFPFPKL